MEMTTLNDEKSGPRKVLKTRALVRNHRAHSITGLTAELSERTVVLVLPDPLSPGESCIVDFQVFDGYAAVPIHLLGKVEICTLNGMKGYRASVRITEADAACRAAIKRLIQ
jgi:hypothetical protein